MLSTTTIDNVRDLPIEQVINKYVTLKKAGSGWAACCPLPGHSEKTPSFHVTPSKNIFKCFGCGAGGDAITFVMLKESYTFVDAVKAIAGDHGIEVVEKEVKGKTEEQKSEETEMLDWLLKAQTKYRKELIERPSVVKYLYSRGLTRSTIIEWQFGVVPDWRIITPDLVTAGKFDIGEKAGLVRKGNAQSWDYFHHRITVPIHDARGVLLGFGGRTTSAIQVVKGEAIEGPKYLNPPDSPLYDKSKTLFGLDKARKHFAKHGMATLVEGYFDVIKMHQQGWNNAVATCGTALTAGQAKQLKRYTDTVLILRDGDNAGLKAIKKDIPILLEQQFTVYVCELPTGEDPDTLFDKPFEYITNVLRNYHDGIEYLCGQWFTEAAGSISDIAKAIEKSVELIANITSQVRRDQYIKAICTRHKQKPAEFTKLLTKELQHRADERESKTKALNGTEVEVYPHWVDRKQLEINGFVQLRQPTEGYKAGIYFSDNKGKYVYQVTNFTINPLYHIYDQSNNRRLIEIDNTFRNSVVELPTQATVAQASFEIELMNKGNFMCYENMARSEFKRMMAWMVSSMPIAYELKTLGWQPEGFFAYSNAVYTGGNLVQYDELGMVNVDDKHYMSLGNSKIHRDDRQIDNPYENDLYLKYIAPRESINFSKWAHLFNESYGVNAPFGIAFAFLTLFKDVATRIAKMPLLYCYGQKGSGKSSMAESITWLFFSGKDAEGSLIKGFNLNPGQSTPFSFFNRVERFRNCPILMNEFDENTVEAWKTGTMKAAYDGEGREVGDGDTGKKRKTKMQKVQGTIILVGQYLAVKDDAAVSSRSIPCQFSVERLKNLTQQQIDNHNLLHAEELQGLSGMLVDLLKYRDDVQKHLRTNFTDIQTQLMEFTRNEGYRIEARLISNYGILLAATKTLTDLGIQLPYTYPEFFTQAVERMIKHNQTLKDNSIVNQFWKAMEVMFDKGIITSNHFAIRIFTKLDIKEGSNVIKKDVKGAVLLLRFSNVYSEYAKYTRERTGQAVQGEETVLMYLKEQGYFIGLSPVHSIGDKRTSAYAFNYQHMQEIGIVLEKEHNQVTANSYTEPEPLPGTADLPF